jgi:hypothetical protein
MRKPIFPYRQKKYGIYALSVDCMTKQQKHVSVGKVSHNQERLSRDMVQPDFSRLIEMLGSIVFLVT